MACNVLLIFLNYLLHSPVCGTEKTKTKLLGQISILNWGCISEQGFALPYKALSWMKQ